MDEIIIGIMLVILGFCMGISCYTKQNSKLKQSINYLQTLYDEEKNKSEIYSAENQANLEHIEKLKNICKEQNTENQSNLNRIKELENIHIEQNKKMNKLKSIDKKFYSIQNSPNPKLIEYWQTICKEQDIEIKKLKDTISEMKNAITSKTNYSSIIKHFISEWKTKYNELVILHKKIKDENTYLKTNYNKQHQEIILLKEKLFLAQKELVDLKKSLSKKYTKEDIFAINSWEKFEKFVANKFKERGYQVISTPLTNDGGKDIIIEKNNIKTYIECKYWKTNNNIGRELIQKLAGASMADGVKNAIFITTSDYHENAINIAKKLNSNGFNIQLWDMHRLLDFINNN